ncbi:MAG TPA: YeeE/YedE thiosulfate transporter family protein [Acidocella sp.]|nr:YeeE/YedE thiosulfate transporter family protein [Acidocella sp.]
MTIVFDSAMLAESLAGGVLIGAASAGLLLVNGRIAGISGVLAGATRPGGAGWQWAFVAGLLVAGAGAALARLPVPQALSAQSLPVLAVAGLLVGVGTHLGNGCTSGHGVCGLARLSPRSLAAVLVFMCTAALVVFIRRHVL